MKKETKKNREGAEASLLRWFRNGAVAAVVVMSWWMAWLEWENARAGERFPLAAVCSLIPVIFLAGSFLSSRLRERRDRKRALQKAAAFRILEEKEGQAQESSMGGRLCFVGCSRTFYWFQGLSALLMVYYLVLVWMEQDELAQSGLSGLLANLPLWIFYLGAVWLVRISMYFYVNRQILTVLTLRDQPLTAAFAYLSAICRLSPGPIVFRIWVDNAAVCLIRGGWYEEALELAEPETAELRPWEKQLAGWQPPESRGGLFWKSQLSLTESHIRSLCLENFGQTEAVEAETAFQKKCLERSSLLRKQPIGRRLHLEHQIRRWADRKPERAIAVLEAYLEEASPEEQLPSLCWQLWELYRLTDCQEEAQTVLTRLLSHGPENEHVRLAMAWGPCTWIPAGKTNQKSGKCYRVLTGIVSAFFGAVGFGALFLSLAFCLEGRTAEHSVFPTEGGEKEFVTIEETTRLPETEEASEETKQESGVSGQEAPAFFLELPEGWENLVIEERQENGTVSFLQKKSWESMGDGCLFSLSIFDDGSYVNLPDYEIWGYDGPYVYVVSRPTDVCFDAENPQTREEYTMLGNQVENLRADFRIDSATARYDGNEFIFPNSSDCRLEYWDLVNLSGSALRIARNEIYARHGRQFEDEELNRYFNSLSWYEGTIAPEEFTDDLLNDTEQANIRLMMERQSEME